MPSPSASIRAALVDALELDLMGPRAGHALSAEQIPQAPSRWYLTGFLVPYEAPESQREDPAATEDLDALSGRVLGDDDTTPDQGSGRKVYLPSSIGVSVLAPKAAGALTVTVAWGDYRRLDPKSTGAEPEPAEGDAPGAAAEEAPARRPGREIWQRTQRQETIAIPLDGKRRPPVEVPRSGGLRVVATVRPLTAKSRALVKGGASALSVSVFLVNHRPPAPDTQKDEAFAFQASMRLETPGGFIARPNLRGQGSDDPDDSVADLQYRNAMELAVGHGVATRARVDPEDGACRDVETTWIPEAEVEKVVPGEDDARVELGMDALGALESPSALLEKLAPLVDGYGRWIEAQRAVADSLREGRRAVAGELMSRASVVQRRIGEGIAALADEKAFEAFRIANRAMAQAARRRSPELYQGREPSWRPFQLAFLLMNVRGLIDPGHSDREVVDLLFFPTGGGKTEAYLGLAAFVLVLRRLRNPGLASAGVSVLMRYTLRLLTLDQFGRAATLICALELARQADVDRLGPWPFEIGLWVGQAATPNRTGKKGDNDRHSARARTIAFQNDDKKPSPIPLESCPWCGTKFTRNAFVLMAGGRPNSDHPTDLRVVCTNRRCDFRGSNALPLVAVDEPLYRRLPCLLIATVDKFASLPWVAETGALFGKVDRFDKEGFYGPTEPTRGSRLERPLLPPDLVIQDELHLISGPLGTMVGLYETAVDALAARVEGGREIRPKVVASTATVRRAERQIKALFARREVEIFPPPGPDVRDSFFAKTVSSSDRSARLYVGVAAQGRSLKVVLLRTYLALMAAAERAYEAEGGAKSRRRSGGATPAVPPAALNPADPYMTLVGYFNSLRELGGSRRIVEDEVGFKLRGYGERLRVGEKRGHGPFASRTITYLVEELTSRRSTSDVAETKRRLQLAFDEGGVDVALATNMISVGLDIVRLGLMVVLGQPKTTAEYIQATSRVGRDDERPGLVVTLLNLHRPRDRSHYERFEAYHASFYRSVEATSVTPFAPRAVDRGLAGVTVALARHGLPELTPPMGAGNIGAVRTKLGFVGEILARRVAQHDVELAGDRKALEEAQRKLTGRVVDLLDQWAQLAHDQQQHGAGLQYQREEGGAPPLLRDPLDPELKTLPRWARKFRANRSLRDVEPNVNLWVRRLDGQELEGEDG